LVQHYDLCLLCLLVNGMKLLWIIEKGASALYVLLCAVELRPLDMPLRKGEIPVDEADRANVVYASSDESRCVVRVCYCGLCFVCELFFLCVQKITYLQTK